MNKNELDNKKIEEINNFFDRINCIYNAFDGMIDADFVYHELCRYSLKDDDIDSYHNLKKTGFLFEEWKNYFSNRNGISVTHNMDFSYFLCFDSKPPLKSGSKYLKLYIPIDYNHLGEAAKRLFDFIEKLGIRHSSKIGKEVRSDNVIVRLEADDFASAKKIIDFINSDEIIKSGLNKPNPFVPTIDGIGYMIESGISYNFEISKLIFKYIKDYNNRLDKSSKPNAEEFYNLYIKNAKIVDKRYGDISDEIREVFLDLISKDKLFNRNIKKDSLVDNGDKGKSSGDDRQEKITLFLNAIKATYNKYGIGHVSYAISNIINNNEYGYFTNGSSQERYRDRLKTSVSKMDIITYIKSTIGVKGDNISDDDIDKFLFCVLKNELVDNFNKCCMVTLDKYDKNQLMSAIHYKMTDDVPYYFAQYPKNGDQSVDYRKIVDSYSTHNIRSVMRYFLNQNGIDDKELSDDELIETYVDVLKALNYHSSKKM